MEQQERQYEEIESYYKEKLRKKDEELRYQYRMCAIGEEMNSEMLSKIDLLHKEFSGERRRMERKFQFCLRAIEYCNDLDRDDDCYKWKEELMKMDFDDDEEDLRGESSTTTTTVNELKFELLAKTHLLKIAKGEILKIERENSETQAENKRVMSKLKDVVDVSNQKDLIVEDLMKEVKDVKRERNAIAFDSAKISEELVKARNEMKRWKLTAEELMREDELIKSELFDKGELSSLLMRDNNNNTNSNGIMNRRMKTHALEIGLEKALLEKQGLEKEVKQLKDEIEKMTERFNRMKRAEEIASAALAALSVPTTTINKSNQQNNKLSAAAHISDLEKKLKQRDEKIERMNETLNEIESEHTKEMKLVHAEHLRMLAAARKSIF